MTESLEQSMKAQLDGHFYSFVHCGNRGTFIETKIKPKDFVPTYTFDNPFLVHSKRGAYSRAVQQAKRAAAVFTPERVDELERLRALGYGEKRIAKAMSISRGLIAGQIKRMGL